MISIRRFGLYHLFKSTVLANTLKQINCHKNALKRYIAISTFMAPRIYGPLRGPGPGPFTPSTPLLDGPDGMADPPVAQRWPNPTGLKQNEALYE